MRLLVPGFCKHAAKGLRITAGGDVAPCAMATGGELHLGNLKHQDFEQIWNGAPARDLRSAHYTWDYPSLCKTCRFTDTVGPQPGLPFVTRFLDEMGATAADVAPVLQVEEPAT